MRQGTDGFCRSRDTVHYGDDWVVATLYWVAGAADRHGAATRRIVPVYRGIPPGAGGGRHPADRLPDECGEVSLPDNDALVSGVFWGDAALHSPGLLARECGGVLHFVSGDGDFCHLCDRAFDH